MLSKIYIFSANLTLNELAMALSHGRHIREKQWGFPLIGILFPFS